MKEKWFRVDQNNQRFGIAAINSDDKVLGNRGWGGPGLIGQTFAVQVDGKVYIFSGCRESIKDQTGNQMRHPSGSGFYGWRWYDVHFERTLEDAFTAEVFNAGELVDSDEHAKAVQIVIDFFATKGIANPNIAPVREVAFSRKRMWLDPRNPQKTIKVNENVN